ncbi:MAG: HD domain-containing protein [Rhodocyclaceae bacterium]|nr:HD domain-containing protein [Rhodocyclaceae bacterium]MBX3668788.1 HD domain-containing protein [Rhodocyclaceae bacterium]
MPSTLPSNASVAAKPPDHAGAVAYALERLARELPAGLSYHTAAHTADDVLPAARRLARLAGVSEGETGLLEVAAAFHDLGYINTHAGHEAASVEIMRQVLPEYGFCPGSIARLAGLVMTTCMPQTPRDELEQLMADADLDVLGRDDFLPTSIALWREQATLGRNIAWPDWLQSQLKFLQNHRYFTTVARRLRDAGKAANIALVERMIREETGPE